MAVNTRGGALEFDAVINMGQFQSQLQRIESQLQGLTKTAQKETQSIDSYVKRATQAIGTYASFAAAGNLITNIVKVRGEFQQLEVAFNTMLGSKEKADKLLAEATELAAKTPFTLQDVGNASKQLLAYGFAADSIVGNIRMLGDIASGVGAPLNDIVFLYGTLRTQGRAYTKDIQQFTGRGIPIIAELAKQFGIAEKEVFSLVESGKVGFPEVEKAMQSLTRQGGMFFNLMEEQSKTLTGLTSNLGDAWARMLNDIGKSNEGLFADAIKGAIVLVENYEEVLDILKVLVITYGAYRAALIATNVATAVATGLSKGYTAAELLRYNAMLLSERAMKLLNATMLSNPYVAVATGIAAVVSAMLILNKTTNTAEQSQRRLASIQDNAAQSIAKEKVVLEGYLRVARDETRSKQEREKAIKAINQISPQYLGNLTVENVRTAEGTKAINTYIEALGRKARAQAAENELVRIEEEKLQVRADLRDKLIQRTKGLSQETVRFFLKEDQVSQEYQKNAKKQINDLNSQSKAIQDLIRKDVESGVKDQGDSSAATKRTVDRINEEIKALQTKRDALSTTGKEYQAYTAQIKKLQKELESITGAKSEKAASKAIKQTAEDLKQVLEEITRAESDARRSGLLREESEIDRINQRYDDLKQKIQDLGISQSQKGGLLQRLENARSNQLGNAGQKQAAEEYKKFIQDTKLIFDQFEEYKLQVGKEKAQELTGFQTAEYENFIDFLKTQLAAVATDKSLAGKIKQEFLGNTLGDAEKEKLKNDTNAMIEQQKDVLDRTVTFNIQRRKIEEKYQKDLAVLRKSTSGDDLKEREAALKEARDQELADLNSSAVRQTAIYKKLNEDIIEFTRAQLKQRVKDLKATLENSVGLTPQMKADIQSYIDQLEGLLKATGSGARIAEDAQEVANYLGTIGSGLGEIASGIEDVNSDLAETIQTLSSMANIAGTAFQAFAQFASGDIAGGIGSTLSVIGQIFSIGKRNREEARRNREELKAFQTQVYIGEQDINALYRERTREQIRLNKLRIDGIKAENELLQLQLTQTRSQAATILAELQKESAKITTQIDLPFGQRDIFSSVSLAGKSFEELEEFYIKGQLEGKAKELFELLKRIKDEGADITKLIEQNKLEAQELFTGTTQDSISDSIIEGFRNGLRGARDFADTFQELMKNAVLQALKYQVLEAPLKEFYNQFAVDAESDGILTEAEVAALQQRFDDIIGAAGKRFEELKKITNVDFTGDSGTGKSLSGAIRGITEQQADLLAGQFGGLRITALEHLRVGQQKLIVLQKIEYNTARLHDAVRILQDFQLNGLKVK